MKPIIFSTEMVRAILEGEKSQTRRVVEPQPENKIERDNEGNYAEIFGGGVVLLKPRYQPNDVLWVRETWAQAHDGSFVYRADRPDDTGINKRSIHMPREAARLFLRVQGVRVERVHEISEDDVLAEGIYCPHESRTAVLEPFDSMCWADGLCRNPEKLCSQHYWEPYKKLWDSLNAKRGYGWDINPWVWVIEFERCEKPKEA